MGPTGDDPARPEAGVGETSGLMLRGTGRVSLTGNPPPSDGRAGALLAYAAGSIANGLVGRPPGAQILLLGTEALIVEAIGGPLFVATMPMDCGEDASLPSTGLKNSATLPHGVALPLAEGDRVRLRGPAFLAVAGLDADMGMRPADLSSGKSVVVAWTDAAPGPCRRLARIDWPTRVGDDIVLPGMGRFPSRRAVPPLDAWLTRLDDRLIAVPEPAADRSARLRTRTLLDGVAERAPQAVGERAFTPDDDPPGVPGP